MSARLILIAVVGIGGVFLYSAGKHDGRQQAADKYEMAAAKRDREVREREAEYGRQISKLETNTKEELKSAKNEIDDLIGQLASSGVRDECPGAGPVPKATATPGGIDGRARKRVAVDTEGLRAAANQCRQCEVKLKGLQEWARGAIELCNGE